jgi:hypothetical protein
MNLLIAMSGLALAHGVGGHDLARWSGDTLRLTLAPPAAAFPEADLDGDGRISKEELSAVRGELKARILEEIQVVDDAGLEGEVGLVDLLSDPDGEHLTALIQLRWEIPPETLSIDMSGFSGAPAAMQVAVEPADASGVGPLSPVAARYLVQLDPAAPGLTLGADGSVQLY